jgi:hypothetical protein
MICEFAQSFPDLAARLLERDRNLTKNFREETVTDLLMASLLALTPFGIRVDYPDEPTTGADMDWIFAAPHEINGGRYLRILLQAKRASAPKGTNRWSYKYLDHGNPLGKQAQDLVNYASASPDGMATLPMYIFYHPSSALDAKTARLPAVEGVNLTFAAHVAPVVKRGCSPAQKRVSFWRKQFLFLTDILCWPPAVVPPATEVGTRSLPNFHPDLVAERLRLRSSEIASPSKLPDGGAPVIEVANNIPDRVRRAIDGQMTLVDREALERPRVVFSTSLRRRDPQYQRVDAWLKSQRSRRGTE